MCRERLGGG
ncbi:hypothetical protein ZEAMMB73_Zm00001d014186 [Zea mays]|uniref:Uncharacterized protein n=1 Tax=Zea mays TaxID=4577 RepID=A0A1D6GQS5_MAIZE|nr:hypothetical protein ZEAMMB73_Zm00001d014186 [Zea mays]